MHAGMKIRVVVVNFNLRSSTNVSLVLLILGHMITEWSKTHKRATQ
jgi:hypothetical protein